MSNETYLIVSYFAVAVLCFGLGLAACRWLRRPVEGIAGALPQENWRKILRRGFPLSTILFVLSSCLAVNYHGCQQKKYEEILQDRSYIIAKNTEQISKALVAIAFSVAVWAIIIALSLRAIRRDVAPGQDRPPAEDPQLRRSS